MAADPAKTSVTAEKPRKGMPWWMVWVWMLVVLVPIVGSVWYAYGHDEPPPDDADLMVPPPIVADAQNGYRVFEQLSQADTDFITYEATHGVDEDDAEKIFSGQMDNLAVTGLYLKHVQPLLEKMETALAMKDFEFSKPVSMDTIIPDAAPLMNCGKILRLAIRTAKAQGDEVTALHDLTLLHQLAVRLASCHGGIITVLTAIALDSLTQGEADRWLNDPAASPESLRALAGLSRQDIDWASAFQSAFRDEYQFFCSEVELIKKHPVGWRSIFGNQSAQKSADSILGMFESNLKPNETRREAAEYYRASVLASTLDYAAGQEALKGKETNSLGSAWKIVLPNGGGRYILSIMIVSTGNILATKDTIEARERSLQVGLALREYFTEFHVLPQKLDELVPKYLMAVPTDPFDGKPLRFDAARSVVYSIGKSLRDQGGSKYLNQKLASQDNQDPESDSQQPTLVLEFQKPVDITK